MESLHSYIRSWGPITWKITLKPLFLLLQHFLCTRGQWCKVTLNHTSQRSGSSGVKQHLFLLFAWYDMAVSWFAEHKLPCNCSAFFLSNAVTPVDGDCLHKSLWDKMLPLAKQLIYICIRNNIIVDKFKTTDAQEYEINMHSKLF